MKATPAGFAVVPEARLARSQSYALLSGSCRSPSLIVEKLLAKPVGSGRSLLPGNWIALA